MTKFKRNNINNTSDKDILLVKTKTKSNKAKVKIKDGNSNGNGNWLTYNQKVFCDEWIKDRNATRAYKVAYPGVKNDNVAAVNGSQHLRKDKLQRYIQQRLAKVYKKADRIIALSSEIKEIIQKKVPEKTIQLKNQAKSSGQP